MFTTWTCILGIKKHELLIDYCDLTMLGKRAPTLALGDGVSVSNIVVFCGEENTTTKKETQ